jgi:RHS repeat-associated protein
VNGTAVTFDADGNMLSGPAPGTLTNTGYSYNARNQPIEAGGFAYTYGVLGNRIAVQSPFNSFTTFVVDPNAALDRILSRTVSGPSGATTTYYIYGLGLIGEETNGTYTAYHFDSRGSTVALTDASGNVTDSFSYGPYGELNNHIGSSTTPFQYNGQFGVQTDPNGLLYMRARYYNPAIRRFVNQDVLFGNVNPGISLNRFAFANGNPISLMDRLGCVRVRTIMYMEQASLGI